MFLKIVTHLDYTFPKPAPVLLQLEVAQLPDQRLVEDKLTVSTGTPLTRIGGECGVGVRCWTVGTGSFRLSYEAKVELRERQIALASLEQDAVTSLGAEVVPFLWPSRYCPSNDYQAFVHRDFGRLNGGQKVDAFVAWIRSHVDYTSGTSDATTTATDSFVRRAGVCRDFAHMLITFARAANIPARMVSAYAWQLQPPDFHALVEVWLNGAWHLVDPTGLAPIEGVARIGVGRDATDIAFMTVFGQAQLNSQSVTTERVDG